MTDGCCTWIKILKDVTSHLVMAVVVWCNGVKRKKLWNRESVGAQTNSEVVMSNKSL